MLLHHKFVETANNFADKIAVFDRTSNKEFSYKKILIASLMLKTKIEKVESDHVGIMLPNSAAGIIAIMATLMAGKIPSVINYSTGAIDNCLYAQKKCGFKAIFTSKGLLEKLELEPIEGMQFLEEILPSFSLFDKVKALLKTKRAKKHIANGNQEDTAVILFTSGSEREPKAVQLTHKNLYSNVCDSIATLGFKESDVYMSVLPFFHIFGLTTNLFIPMLSGAQAVTFANPLDFKAIVENIKNYKISVLLSTPAFFFGYAAKARKGDFDSLRVAVAGADKLGTKVRELYERKHGKQILEGYGTTETSPVVSTNLPGATKHGSIGRPLKNVQVKVVSIETGEDLGFGEEGKLLVKGDLVMKGYLGEPELTANAIRDGWYDTGDVAVIDPDGFIWHKGRLKRFLKIGGEMVSLVHVESVVGKYLQSDIQYCAVPRAHELKGSEIILVTSKEIDVEELSKNISEELPPLMTPKHFEVIEEIPMTGSGKVNFREVERLVSLL